MYFSISGVPVLTDQVPELYWLHTILPHMNLVPNSDCFPKKYWKFGLCIGDVFTVRRELVYRHVHKIAKSDYQLRRVSVRPHGATRLPLDGFSWNVVFEYFAKICPENSSFIKIWGEEPVLYMKQTNIHFLSYLAQFFLEWEIFQTKVVEKIKTHILFSVTVLRKSCQLWDNVKLL